MKRPLSDEPVCTHAMLSPERGRRMSQLHMSGVKDYIGKICHDASRALQTVVIVDVTREEWGLCALVLYAVDAARSMPMYDLVPACPVGTLTTRGALADDPVCAMVCHAPQGFTPDDMYRVGDQLLVRASFAATGQVEKLDDVPSVFNTWQHAVGLPVFASSDFVADIVQAHPSMSGQMISALQRRRFRSPHAFRAQFASPSSGIALPVSNPIVRHLAYIVTTQLPLLDPHCVSAQQSLLKQLEMDDGSDSLFCRIVAAAKLRSNVCETRIMIVQRWCRRSKAHRDVTRSLSSLQFYLMPFLLLLPLFGCGISRKSDLGAKCTKFTLSGPRAMLDVGIALCLGVADSVAEVLVAPEHHKSMESIMRKVQCVATHHRSMKLRSFV